MYLTKYIVILLAFSLGSTASHADDVDPDNLWKIVSLRCVPDQKEFGSPAPCETVDPSNGYVILRDVSAEKPTNRLLIPTMRIVGLGGIGKEGAINYWRFGWQARRSVLSRDYVGMAVNSDIRRSQAQLHIHIDCLSKYVVDELKKWEANAKNTATRTWQRPFDEKSGDLAPYRTMRIESDDLSDVDPSKLVYDSLGADKASMPLHTIVVAGVSASDRFKAGFYILDSVASETPSNHGSGERLLDHKCAIAASLR
ncbi:CDP-diacylglycerol pyrophosphatase [Herbaspirillum sp. CF444]|uniref:CDP-diacylglycerol diphosphatase n=1 Tax=Herbaspirillum sp. CF444 TaxID=1144319 RepID=UPI0002724099|nr:CDP-diacylglycerol diphosphatase [Herbaspirillum sp. CF444]EJL83518.1 CDP-diacylglycerol pyrophosphatase [Herbaspirillum sp. CF444]